jgi:serine protease
VINLSLGGSGACSSTWQNAINAVTAAGVVVVVAAGNSNASAANYSPASCNGVVTVAATGKAGNRAYYSNFGSAVEIAAPGGDKTADGVGILSTLNSGTTGPITGGDIYGDYQGTSMATPHVVGVVSLMLSVQPGLSPAQVTTMLQASATPFPGGSTCISKGCGAGILDAAAAVTRALGPALAPPAAFNKTSPGNAAGNQPKTVTLRWETSNLATSYQVCIDASVNATCNGTWTTVAGTSVGVTGLAGKRTYEWQVRALNADGTTYANAGTWWTFKTK